MDSEQGNRRRVCRKSHSIDPSSPTVSRTSKTIVDTSYRTHLLTDVRYTVDKLSRMQLFKIHNIVNRTGYRILIKETVRYSKKVYNRDRKRILTLYEYEIIKTIKDVNFNFIFFSYFKITNIINIINNFECTI